MGNDIHDDPWVSRARIGADAEAFLGSPLGRYLQGRSNREINQYTLDLINARPDDIDDNRELRRKIHRAGDAIEWLIEAINDAEQARMEIQEQEAHE